jgi:4-alpha-glucanotransferase
MLLAGHVPPSSINKRRGPKAAAASSQALLVGKRNSSWGLPPRSELPRSTLAQALFGLGSAPAAPAEPAGPYDRIPIGGDLPAEYSDDIPNWANKRRAGVILHPTSLPGPYGIGEIGQEARRFVDWLESAGMQAWQILPLVPPDPMFYSPYSGTDSNAGNPLVISIDELIKEGLLEPSDAPPRVPVADVDFPKVGQWNSSGRCGC